ncbi:hypothetical protein CDD83_3642 [Cordyceps sp. RAO-2017]|nr:hypothetical protein CDD83_3642 [Cordyceps sp. RAO-2017]
MKRFGYIQGHGRQSPRPAAARPRFRHLPDPYAKFKGQGAGGRASDPGPDAAHILRRRRRRHNAQSATAPDSRAHRRGEPTAAQAEVGAAGRQEPVRGAAAAGRRGRVAALGCGPVPAARLAWAAWGEFFAARRSAGQARIAAAVQADPAR